MVCIEMGWVAVISEFYILVPPRKKNSPSEEHSESLAFPHTVLDIFKKDCRRENEQVKWYCRNNWHTADPLETFFF